MSYSRRVVTININPVKQPQDVYPPIYQFQFTRRYSDGHQERGVLQGDIEIFMRDNNQSIDLRSKNLVTDILRERKQFELNNQHRQFYSSRNVPGTTVFTANRTPGGAYVSGPSGGYTSSANSGGGYASSAASSAQVHDGGYTSKRFCK
jgi:hypothetical protein